MARDTECLYFIPEDFAPWPGVWNECAGEYYPIRSAGDRYTGPKRDVLDNRFLQGDPLSSLNRCRQMMAGKREPGMSEAGYKWRVMNARNHYDIARMRAFGQSSRVGLLTAERKANDVRLFASLRGEA